MNDLTIEEMQKLPHVEWLKYIVKRTEERIVDWKKQLADYHKNKIDAEWFKEMLRDSKNWDEKWLKDLREELTNLNQGTSGSIQKMIAYSHKEEEEQDFEFTNSPHGSINNMTDAEFSRHIRVLCRKRNTPKE